MKTHLHLLLTIIITLNCVILPVTALCTTTDSTQNYSIKHRWTIKTSVAAYKCWMQDLTHAVGYFENEVNIKRLNFRVEANYGINKYFEIGVFAGFQRYLYTLQGESDTINNNDAIIISGYEILKKNLAPVFGVNVNFHLLPIFVSEKKCRWDLYLTARYGFCFLPHVEHHYLEGVDKHYRQEYCIGTGIAYYFGNRIGLYTEFSLGNYSYFPRFVDSNFSFRTGITCKF